MAADRLTSRSRTIFRVAPGRLAGRVDEITVPVASEPFQNRVRPVPGQFLG